MASTATLTSAMQAAASELGEKESVGRGTIGNYLFTFCKQKNVNKKLFICLHFLFTYFVYIL